MSDGITMNARQCECPIIFDKAIIVGAESCKVDNTSHHTRVSKPASCTYNHSELHINNHVKRMAGAT